MRMKLIGLLGSVLLTLPAMAFIQWDMPLSDWDDVLCWNPDWCSVTEATLYVSHFEAPDHRALPCQVIGPHGQPLMYSIAADFDDQLGCDGNYAMDSLVVVADGPGFHYRFMTLPTVEIYPCDLTFPVILHVPPGDGCTGPDEWCPDLTWECYPDGQVAVLQNHTIPAGTTVHVAAGLEVYALPGVSIIVEGSLMVDGSPDSMVTFTGDSWNGLVFANGSQSELRHCRITEVDSPDDGGALTVAGGATVTALRCLIDHNHAAGEGGAALIEDGGILSIFNSTISHNSGGTSGGVHLAGPNALFECDMSLLTFADPPGTDLTGTGFTNITFTNLYPQEAPWPLLHCDPGYWNPLAGDFHISYGSLAEPDVANCAIDVDLIGLEHDPDGTALDLGIFPFDQRSILLPATHVTPLDRPNDQGGFVLLSFHASRNDGSQINPVTLYSIWERYPGTGPDDWVSAGTVAAMSDSSRTYEIQVPTLDDQFEGHDNIHTFRVGTHSVHFPQPAWSSEVSGVSLDNLAPPAVTDIRHSDWYYDQWPPTQNLIIISWDFNPPQDFSHFYVKGSEIFDHDAAPIVYIGSSPEYTFAAPVEEPIPEVIHFWIRAVDQHQNMGPVVVFSLFNAVDDSDAAAWLLSANVPNPFNPVTRIAYSMPAASPVRLGVYNLQGQLVQTLVDEFQPAGQHAVLFDGHELASGVYIYQLETPAFVETKKMILTR